MRKLPSFWASLRGSFVLLVVAFSGLLLIEVYHWWASDMAEEAARQEGLRKYLLGVLAGENGPFAILYNIAHFSMAVLIMVGFVWGLAVAMLSVLGDLDPERTFFQNAAEQIFGTLGRASKDTGVPVGLAVRIVAPVVSAGVLAGAVFSVSTSLASWARETRKETQRWEEVSSSLDRLEILWAAGTGTGPGPSPPPPPPSDDLYPVFARYNGVVLDAWKQGERISQSEIVVKQDCEALDREILRTQAELFRIQAQVSDADIRGQEESPEDTQSQRAEQRLKRFERLRKEKLISDEWVDEVASEAKIANQRKHLAARDREQKRKEALYSRGQLGEWLDFLKNLRKGCEIPAPVSGVVEKIVKKGAYASADSDRPIAWIRADR